MIAIDVGNTKTAVAFFRDGVCAARWTLGTSPLRSVDEYRIFLNECLTEVGESLRSSGGMILASVVPAATEEIRLLGRETDLHVVTHKTPVSFRFAVPQPEAVGADRIASLEGAFRKQGAPAVVLDTGTATTLSVIDADRRFIGGAIAPGLRISLEALASRTALLPTIDMALPERAIGPTTGEAMMSGAVLGHARMIDGLIGQMRDELGQPNAPVIATGGGMATIVPALRTKVTFDPFLTIDGLRYLFENLTEGKPHA
ncbi:MAG: type III pantothenate kinase [Pseudomonadota bacterium]